MPQQAAASAPLGSVRIGLPAHFNVAVSLGVSSSDRAVSTRCRHCRAAELAGRDRPLCRRGGQPAHQRQPGLAAGAHLLASLGGQCVADTAVQTPPRALNCDSTKQRVPSLDRCDGMSDMMARILTSAPDSQHVTLQCPASCAPRPSEFPCPSQVFGLLSVVYFALHYMFASQTAHVGALYSAFLAMMISAGASTPSAPAGRPQRSAATSKADSAWINCVFSCQQSRRQVTRCHPQPSSGFICNTGCWHHHMPFW